MKIVSIALFLWAINLVISFKVCITKKKSNYKKRYINNKNNNTGPLPAEIGCAYCAKKVIVFCIGVNNKNCYSMNEK